MSKNGAVKQILVVIGLLLAILLQATFLSRAGSLDLEQWERMLDPATSESGDSAQDDDAADDDNVINPLNNNNNIVNNINKINLNNIINNNNNNGESTQPSQEPLNVLIIYPDDWRYDALEELRPGVVFTPFLTKLASEGIRFTQNFVTTSICWISRATLFTGRYASQHASSRLKCPRFAAPYNWNGTWPYILQTFGNYFVGHVGKWQYHMSADVLFDWSRFHEGKHWYMVKGKKIHAADRATNDAIDFLRERPKDRNFALTVAFYPPKPIGNNNTPGTQWEPHPDYLLSYRNHSFLKPYNFTEAFQLLPEFLMNKKLQHVGRYKTRYQTEEMYQVSLRNYFALVSHIDYSTSKIVEELKQQGILNKTMIIVTADNGLMMGHHGIAGKWHPFEESIRVPLIIYDPRMPKSKVGIPDKESITLNIDLAPTIVGAANLQPDSRMQGRNIADLYLGTLDDDDDDDDIDDPWRQDFFYEFPLQEFPDSTALRTSRYKYMVWPGSTGRGMELLYDLEKDPYELEDLLHPKTPQNMTQPPPSSTSQGNNQTTSQKSKSKPSTTQRLPPVTNDTVSAEVWQVLQELRIRHKQLQDYYVEPNVPKEECTRADLPK